MVMKLSTTTFPLNWFNVVGLSFRIGKGKSGAALSAAKAFAVIIKAPVLLEAQIQGRCPAQ